MTTVSVAPGATVTKVVVPDGVTSVSYDVAAGSGVAVASFEIGAGVALPGGRAARVRGVLAVTPGSTLWISAGGQGQASATSTTPSGLGDGGVAAGAATMIGVGNDVTLASVVVAAGAGGGGGEDGAGGDGGGVGGRSPGTGGGGLGGGQDSTWTDPDGESTTTDGCGGGGGGYRGGRAGTVLDGKRGGGGGGSSLVPAGATLTNDWTGPGFATLVYGAAPLAPTNVVPANGGAIPAGRPFDVTWDFVGAIVGDKQGSATVVVNGPGGSFTRTIKGEGEVASFPEQAAAMGTITAQVTTAQTSGAVGPSTTTTFVAATPVAAPVLGVPDYSVATSPSFPLPWTAVEQVQYRLRRTDPTGSTVYADDVVTSSTVRLRTLDLQNGREELVRLSVFGANGVESDPDTVRVLPQFVRPALPNPSLVADPGTALRAPSMQLVVSRTETGRPARVRSTVEVQAIAPPSAVRAEPRHPIETDTDAGGVTRWRLPRSGVVYQVIVTDYDANGVPSVGTSDPGLGGWGVSPWGVGPWGS